MLLRQLYLLSYSSFRVSCGVCGVEENDYGSTFYGLIVNYTVG